MEWTKEIIMEVIEMYRVRPCLWKVKDKAYLNKNLKREAYNEILAYVRSKKGANVTVKDIKTKIQNLRSSYRKEKKNSEDSTRSGTGTEDIYTPTLWYFNLLVFTNDQDTPVKSIDNISTQESDCAETSDEENTVCETPTPDTREQNSPSESREETKKTTKLVFKQPLPKPKKRKTEQDPEIREFMKACTQTLTTPVQTNEFDNICTAFATKLKKMEPRQQIFAEALMHKVVTQGLLGTLNEHIDLVDQRNAASTFPSYQLSQYSPTSSTHVPSPGSSGASSGILTEYYNTLHEALDADAPSAEGNCDFNSQ